MKERILEFLKAENKSSAQFAEEIGVQPSGISHILSGRNNPSLDFVLKMLEKYEFLSTDWLLFGQGLMYKEKRMQSLFDENIISDHVKDLNPIDKADIIIAKEKPDKQGSMKEFSSHKDDSGKSASVSRIIWFFDDNSYEEYFPR